MNTSFERSSTKGKEEWLTPPAILKALGVFDLDPCAPTKRPWDTAKRHYTQKEDGLKQPWFGRVFMNPPYGSKTQVWMQKLKEHGNGIALIFARTETQNYFDHIWHDADAILFLKGRLTFYHVSGKPATEPAGAPSVLVAYGKRNATVLKNAKLEGKFIQLKP